MSIREGLSRLDFPQHVLLDFRDTPDIFMSLYILRFKSGFAVNSPIKRRVIVGPMQGPFEFLELKLPKPLNRQCLDKGIPVFSVKVQLSILVFRLSLIKAPAA